ncbi:MAG: thiamine phosphate synthase [Magnetococcales bacterium]|nr:thiamine phosphate synthase [Magnetococcales bacterium]
MKPKKVIPQTLLITHSTLRQDWMDAAVEAGRGGIGHILLRDPGASAALMITQAQTLQARLDNTMLLIHDRVDVALAVKADGVHLPGHGLSPVQARTQLGPTALIGCSCHTVEQATVAFSQGADYVTLSPLFATQSHPDASPLGKERFSDMLNGIDGPVLALGGITPDNAAIPLSLGAYGVAMIRGILDQKDPCDAVKKLRTLMKI